MLRSMHSIILEEFNMEIKESNMEINKSNIEIKNFNMNIKNFNMKNYLSKKFQKVDCDGRTTI